MYHKSVAKHIQPKSHSLSESGSDFLNADRQDNQIMRQQLLRPMLSLCIILQVICYFVFLAWLTLSNQWLVSTDNHHTMITRSIRQFYDRAMFHYEPANQIIDARAVQNSGQVLNNLPFCLVLPTALSQNSQEIKIIRQSVTKLNYNNYFVAEGELGPYSYLNYSALVRAKCPRRSPILFVSGQLQPNALVYLNSQYQRHDAWLLYSKQQPIMSVWSMHERVFDLVAINDFSNKYSNFISSQDPTTFATMITLALIELCPYSMLEVDQSQLFAPGQHSKIMAPLQLNTSSEEVISRPMYMQLAKLSQDFYLDSDYLDSIRFAYTSLISTGIEFLSEVNRKKMLQAVQRQQIPYLPLAHSIAQIEEIHYSRKYSIGQFRSVDKQVPFCVSVMSRNNVENSRHLKLVESILQQNYQNYRVIFIDDFSEDRTLQQTMRIFKDRGFIATNLPRHRGGRRAVFIRNRKQMGTTHNFLNAAFNYCDEDEVQLLIDGDDLLIGREVFSVLNSAYQLNKGLWYVYSCYKDSQYRYGRSFATETDLVVNGVRTLPTPVGAIRSYYVKLIRSIPLAYHKMPNNMWLDTLSDDALSFSLIELVSMKRTKYIPELLYEYNVFFGVHDNQTPERQLHRDKIRVQTMKKKPLPRVSDLESIVEDYETANTLRQQKGVIFDEVPL